MPECSPSCVTSGKSLVLEPIFCRAEWEVRMTPAPEWEKEETIT